MNDNTYKNIPLRSINPNPAQPRKYFDPDAMDALTQSVERYGVLSPITVRRCATEQYELISGERRYRAAYAAGLKDIPCIVIDTDGSDCAILSLLENLQREDLSFLEVAESYRELIKKQGYSGRDISRRIGDMPYNVKDRADLMKLDPLVRKYIRSYKLTEKQAHSLLKIRNPELQIETVRKICENNMNEDDSIAFVNGIIKNSKEPSIHINRIKDIKILKNTLTNAVSLIRLSGINAEYREKLHTWGEEFIIVIHNSDN